MTPDIRASIRDHAIFLTILSLVMVGTTFTIAATTSSTLLNTQPAFIAGSGHLAAEGGGGSSPSSGSSGTGSNPGAGGDPTNNDNGTVKGSTQGGPSASAGGPSSNNTPSTGNNGNPANSGPGSNPTSGPNSQGSSNNNGGNNPGAGGDPTNNDNGTVRGSEAAKQAAAQQAARTQQYANDLSNYGAARAQAETVTRVNNAVSNTLSKMAQSISQSFNNLTGQNTGPVRSLNDALGNLSQPNNFSSPYTNRSTPNESNTLPGGPISDTLTLPGQAPFSNITDKGSLPPEAKDDLDQASSAAKRAAEEAAYRAFEARRAAALSSLPTNVTPVSAQPTVQQPGLTPTYDWDATFSNLGRTVPSGNLNTPEENRMSLSGTGGMTENDITDDDLREGVISGGFPTSQAEVDDTLSNYGKVTKTITDRVPEQRLSKDVSTPPEASDPTNNDDGTRRGAAPNMGSDPTNSDDGTRKGSTESGPSPTDPGYGSDPTNNDDGTRRGTTPSRGSDPTNTDQGIRQGSYVAKLSPIAPPERTFIDDIADAITAPIDSLLDSLYSRKPENTVPVQDGTVPKKAFPNDRIIGDTEVEDLANPVKPNPNNTTVINRTPPTTPVAEPEQPVKPSNPPFRKGASDGLPPGYEDRYFPEGRIIEVETVPEDPPPQNDDDTPPAQDDNTSPPQQDDDNPPPQDDRDDQPPVIDDGRDDPPPQETLDDRPTNDGGDDREGGRGIWDWLFDRNRTETEEPDTVATRTSSRIVSDDVTMLEKEVSALERMVIRILNLFK